MLKKIFSCIDNTALAGTDTHATIEQLCRQSLTLQPQGCHVSAVCVYPVFVSQAAALLHGSGIKVATVVGGFPAGQTPLEVKLHETEYALKNGADEIDMVISRCQMFEGDYDSVRHEVAAIKQICQANTLKVILETGELGTSELIATASQMAIEGGADFIKTSTGKSTVSATPEAVQTMLEVIKKHYLESGSTIGLKVAGGLTTVPQVLNYTQMAASVMGNQYINSKTFRIGTSRLVAKIGELLLDQINK